MIKTKNWLNRATVALMFTTREAEPDDAPAILDLLPRLADYELPEGRRSEMFWADDADLIQSWAEGEAEGVHLSVGDDAEGQIVGAAMITIGPDKFSGEACAHLEVVVIAPAADGSGLGRQLISDMEERARSLGATIMSLHVMGNNGRARHVYQELGFSEEMIRAVKWL